jgi:hypothetical protein
MSNTNNAVTKIETTEAIQGFLYYFTDAELIRKAGEMLGTQKLRLSLAEAVECIRTHFLKVGVPAYVSKRWEVAA